MKAVKKGLAVSVILLFIGLAFAPSINAVDDPVPDLDCEGDLYWVEVEPGSAITGDFIVENIGEPLSELDWEIESYPDWGTWTFTPDGYMGLKPEDGWMAVYVEVVAPDEIEDDLWGEVKIVNLDNPDDYCIIDAWIRVKSIDDATSLELKVQRIKELVQSINLQKIIVNTDVIVDTLEEISTIIEGDEELNSIYEQLTAEDCGCEDDSTSLEWPFPIICILLLPLWAFGMIAYFMGGPTFWGELAYGIGGIFNCFWA